MATQHHAHPQPQPVPHPYYNQYQQPQTPAYPQNYPQQEQSQQYPQQQQPQQPPREIQPQQQHYHQQQQWQQPPSYQQQQQERPTPPPPPPPHQQRQQRPQEARGPPPVSLDSKQRPKSRTFSFRSDKSHKSADLHETSAEKEAKRLHSKADPTLAMNEAEPGVVAATVKSSLASLRNMQHRDAYGNVIDEPDRSNPTRSRWERPLDTIRSFEAAIDGGYNRQSIMIRSETDSVANWNRRSGYFGANNQPYNNGSRLPRDSFYGARSQSYMPNQNQPYEGWRYNGQEQYGDPQGHNAYNNVARHRYSRMASDHHYSAPRQPDQNIYPVPTNHRSDETVTSASGSGTSGDPAGYQTDPTSSDNSSIERVQSPPKRQQEPVNDYGIGFSQTATYQPSTFTVGINSGSTVTGSVPVPQATYQNGGGDGALHAAPPPVPRKEGSILRKPTRTAANVTSALERPGTGEKRKSWFARRFSKNG